jgi:transcriptional regulator with XRE-family HTH domain
MENTFDNGKIAVGLRTARAAAGWNQQEFAERMGVAKSTVARIETLEMAARGDFIIKAIRLFRDVGVDMDLSDPHELPIKVSKSGLSTAIHALGDQTKRRSDRKAGIASLLPDDID